jgi:hypothetical protein
MGFDIHIYCSFSICKETGKLFYYGGPSGLQKIYDISNIVIPEEHREFVRMRGHLFGIYTRFITDEMSTSVTNFVDKYPEWSDIMESSDFEECASHWNEDMHDRFYAALKWFADQQMCYMICWDY